MKGASGCRVYGPQWDKIERILRLTYEFACSHSQEACSFRLKQSMMGNAAPSVLL